MNILEHISYPGAQTKLSIAEFLANRADDVAIRYNNALGVSFNLRRISGRLAKQVVSQTEHFIVDQPNAIFMAPHPWVRIRNRALTLVGEINNIT